MKRAEVEPGTAAAAPPAAAPPAQAEQPQRCVQCADASDLDLFGFCAMCSGVYGTSADGHDSGAEDEALEEDSEALTAARQQLLEAEADGDSSDDEGSGETFVPPDADDDGSGAAAAAGAGGGGAPGGDGDEERLAGVLASLLRVAQGEAGAAALPPDAVHRLRESLGGVQTYTEAAAQFAAQLEALQRDGLPPTDRLLCCGGRCVLKLLLHNQEGLMQVCGESRRLRERFKTRPPEAVFNVKRLARRYNRKLTGDATSSGRAVNRQVTPSRVTDELIELDTQGYFKETRRRERRRYLAAQLGPLHQAGVCIRGITAILHCSNNMLYAPRTGLLHQEHLHRCRQHGSRAGLPPWERLAGTKCCSRGCLLEISVEALKAQHEEWAAATTESQRLDVLASLLWDKPSARIAPYCWRRFYLAHGISRRRVDVVTAYLTTGSRPEHGLTGTTPANAWPEALRASIISHFDLYTWGRPEDNTVRPSRSDHSGLPDLHRFYQQMHPAASVAETTYRRRIVSHLKDQGKQLLGWGADHNIGAESLRVNDEVRDAGLLLGIARNALKNCVAEGERPRLEKAVKEREAALKEKEKQLDDHLKPVSVQPRLALALTVADAAPPTLLRAEVRHPGRARAAGGRDGAAGGGG